MPENPDRADEPRDDAKGGVSAEQLVAAGARKRHLPPQLRGRFADEIRIQSVDGGLIHRLERLRQFVAKSLAAERPCRVLRPVLPRDDLCERRLVFARADVLFESQSHRSHRRARFRGERHDGARVAAGGEKRADRHVADQVVADRLGHGVADHLLPLALRMRARVHGIAQHRRQRKIRLRLGRPGGGDRHPASCRDRADGPVHRERLRHAAPQQKSGDARRIARRGDGAAGEKRLDLRRDAHRFLIVCVVQRLDSVRIAREEHGPRSRIPDAEREHPAQLRQHRRPLLSVHPQKHLGIRGGVEILAGCPELVAQLAIVVDLAVEDDGQIALAALHRLIGAIADVDDRQPAVSEADAAVFAEPVAGGIGSAQAHRFTGAKQLVFVDQRRRRMKRVDGVDAAHALDRSVPQPFAILKRGANERKARDLSLSSRHSTAHC